MIGVRSGEPVAERPVPESPLSRPRRRAELATVHDDEVHDGQSRHTLIR
jgi:hypothetical protein